MKNRLSTAFALCTLLLLSACSGSEEVTDEDTGSDASADIGVETDVAEEVGAECGNGVVESGESCDGDDLGGETCASQGFDEGVLACNANCTFDASACVAPDLCGNGVVDDGESCDGDPVAATCADAVPETPFGEISCADNCSLDTSACTDTTTCGDGRVEGDEECDDGNSVANDGCSDGCLDEFCGDGIVQDDELCEPGTVAITDCGGEVGVPGVVTCSDDCSEQTEECEDPSLCGNGEFDIGEGCDDGDNSSPDDCNDDCLSLTCDNGTLESYEFCDGELFAFTCLDQGFDRGLIVCSDACVPDLSGCGLPACGDGVLEDTGEECDDGNQMDGDGCSSTCAIEATGGPVAELVPSTLIAGAGSTLVEFDASGSTGSDGTPGSIVSYEWDFGDGDTDVGPLVSHFFLVADTYTVTLTVTDTDGETAIATAEIFVGEIPIISFTSNPIVGPLPLTVTYDASASSDPDGEIVSFDWIFADGATGSGAIVEHTYTSVPTETFVRLTVTDNDGLTNFNTLFAPGIIAGAPPTADFTLAPPVGCTPFDVTFDATTSTDDGSIVSYDWNFGDGTTGTGSTPTHTYGAAGTYTVTLTVTDNDGDTDVSTRDVQAIEPTPGLAQWTGLSTTSPGSWNEVDNWCPNALPGPTDTVYIPSGLAHYPTSTTSRNIGGIIVEFGARVDVEGSLNIAGPVENDGQIFVAEISNWDDTVRNDGTVGGTGEVRVSLDGMTLHGDFSQVTINSGASVTLDDDLSTGRGLFINGALTVGPHQLNVGGTFTKGGNGDLIMTDDAGRILIGGATTFQEFGAPSGDLITAGTISVQGPTFSADTNAFAPTGTHETFFEATAAPTRISASAAGVEFNDVTFGSVAGIEMAQSITIRGTTRVDRGSVTAATGSTRANLYGDLIDVTGGNFMVGGTVTLKDDVSLPPFINATLEVDSGVTVVLDNPLIVRDDVVLNGTLDLGGESLDANQRFVVNFAGALVMRTPTDQLIIRGRALFNGSSGPADRHSAGTVFFFGDVWSCGAEGFFGTGTNTVSLQGPAAQELTSSSSLCQFQDLDLNNPGGIDVTGGFTVLGDVLATNGITSSDAIAEQFTIGGTVLRDGSLLQVARITFTGSPDLPSQLSVGEVLLQGPTTLSRDVVIDGALRIGNPAGSLTVGAHELIVRGDFDTTNNGNLFMNDPGSLVTIEGDAFFAGLGDPLGTGDALGPAIQLNEGTLTLLGDLTTPLVVSGLPRYFYATGSHLTVFGGTARQDVFIDGGSQFAEVDFGPGVRFVTSPLTTDGNVDVREDMTFTSPVTINGELTVTSGTLTNESTLNVSGLTGVANGAAMTVNPTGSVRTGTLEVFGTLTNLGSFDVLTDILLGSTGTIRNDGTFNYAGTLTDAGGTVTGTQPIVDTSP